MTCTAWEPRELIRTIDETWIPSHTAFAPEQDSRGALQEIRGTSLRGPRLPRQVREEDAGHDVEARDAEVAAAHARVALRGVHPRICVVVLGGGDRGGRAPKAGRPSRTSHRVLRAEGPPRSLSRGATLALRSGPKRSRHAFLRDGGGLSAWASGSSGEKCRRTAWPPGSSTREARPRLSRPWRSEGALQCVRQTGWKGGARASLSYPPAYQHTHRPTDLPSYRPAGGQVGITVRCTPLRYRTVYYYFA